MKPMEEMIDRIARRRGLFIGLLVFVFLAQSIAAFAFGITVGRNQVLCYLSATGAMPDKGACGKVSWLIRYEQPKATSPSG